LRRVSVLAVMALAVEAATVAGESGVAVAAPRAPAPHAAVTHSVSGPLGPAQAADVGSARLMARLQGRQVEVLGERTDASQTFVNADGTVTFAAFAQPRWVKRAGGWVDADPTLVLRADGSVGPSVSESALSLSDGGSGPLVSMTVDGKSVSVSWPSALPAPVLSGATATYPGVLKDVDLQVTATAAGGAEETLVVKTPEAAGDPGLADLVQSVATGNGVTCTADAGGNLSVRDTGGREVVTAPAPMMWDSATTAEPPAAASPSGPAATPAAAGTDRPAASTTPGPAASAPAAGPSASSRVKVPAGSRSTARGAGSRAHRARVRARLKGGRLHLLADQGLLKAKSTVLPVFIDPAFVPHPASGSTLHFDEVQQAFPTVSNFDAAPSSGNGVGFQGFSSPTGIERTYYSLGMPAAVYGAHILSATLNTKVTFAAASGSNSTTVNVFSTAVVTSASTWNNQPAKATGISNPNFPNPNTSKSFTTTSQSPNLPVAFDVTAGMQAAADERFTNWTLGLFNATETNDVDLVRFASNPTFSITYNNPPATPASLAVAPSATAGFTSTGTPTFSGTASDANSDTVRTDFQVLQGTTVRASGSSAFVTSGTAGTWKPSTALAEGAYTWQARAFDGKDFSAWSTAKALTVDTHAPATTTVTSSDFPANTASGTPDANGDFSGVFTFTPPTSDVGSVVWNLDGGTVHTHATTGSPVSDTVTFRAGPHTLGVRTKDKAGNTSALTSYVFTAGSGAALSTPGEGDRPARRVSLTGHGKSTETGVTYQYRIGATDTWHNVPTADVTVTSTGGAVTAWPLPAPAGVPAALTWNITTTLAQDGPVDVRAVFTDGTTPDNSPPNTITVDRNAGQAPGLDAGPASVNALTGDATLSATDVSVFDMTVTRTASSRRPGNGAGQDGQVAIFGPQWTAGTTAEITDSDWSYIHTTSATSLALVDVDGNPTGFTVKNAAAGTWTPEPGAEDLTLTGKTTDGTLTLTDTDGTTTTFAKPAGASTWQLSTSRLATDNSTTTVVPDAVQAGGLVRPKYVIAPTSAATAAACQTSPATKGCRVLEYVYATTTTATTTSFGNFAGQVQQIRLWATTPGDTASTPTAVEQYLYDNAGQLRHAWDPRISPNLKTVYTYNGDGRVATQAAPGQLPWTFTYGNVGSAATAGDGMLVSASRPTLTPGSASQTDGGAATTSIVYNVPLSGGSAPYAMGASDVAAWGQGDAPADSTAVFPADQVPGSHDGGQLHSGDYQRAAVTYTDASGREVNTAAPGGHITTTEYDRFGNTVRELTAANRELALATSGIGLAELQSLGIDGLSTADRAQQLSTTSTYNTTSVAADAGSDKDTDPANLGQRQLEESGPLHMVTLAGTLQAPAGGTDLPAGTQVPAREHTVTAYDQGRPSDGTATASNQATTVTTGADVDGYPTDADTRVSTTAYDWVKGLPTSTTTDPGGLNLTKTTQYDAQGRVIKTTLPKSTGSDAGATITTYYSATGTGTCNGHPEWADLVCSVGPAGAITGGGTNPTQLPTRTTTYDRWGNTATEADVANGVTRTTTTTYDGAGRPGTVTVTGGTGTAVPDQTTTYDQANGKVAATSAAGHTITQVYDTLGRQISYNDGAGNTATTAYDALDRPTTTTDSAPSTTTYTYNTTLDPRGLETSRTDSVAGTFTATYNADGDLASEGLPGGYTLTVSQDETGTDTSHTYTRNSDTLTLTTDTASETVQGQQATHITDTGNQAYTYDAAGRLTNTDDTQNGTTTHRAYAFDNNTNRTGLTTATDNPDGTAGTPVSTAYTYDSADRLQTVGGTSGIIYDAFGRTTTQTTGTSIGYYTNDLVRTQTSASGASRQTWSLDAAQRLASWTTETNNAGTWTQTGTKTNHYGSDTDSPDWTAEDTTGTLTRNIQGPTGDLDATTTGATGSTTLQLTDLHGDTTAQLPLDDTVAPTVLAYDEYGNPETPDQPPTRYGWLGAKQRSTESPTGATLMGVRLYDPTLGRFLQTDPVPGGNANPYDYCSADSINCYDLNGQWGWHVHWRRVFHRSFKIYCDWLDPIGCKSSTVAAGAFPWGAKKKKVRTNSGGNYKTREEAEREARAAARSGGRCRYRGVCRAGDHVHVDFFNKFGELLHTIHYRWIR
jgi:RHS repeat-associated protein